MTGSSEREPAGQIMITCVFSALRRKVAGRIRTPEPSEPKRPMTAADQRLCHALASQKQSTVGTPCTKYSQGGAAQVAHGACIKVHAVGAGYSFFVTNHHFLPSRTYWNPRKEPRVIQAFSAICRPPLPLSSGTARRLTDTWED